MEESWRFQPARGSICPTCRVSHFPFCPPPLPFYGNGFPPDDPFRFPAEAPAFHRPVHAPSPFPEHRRMSPPPLPHHPNPMAQRGAEPWSGYSLPERDPFRQPFHPTERLISEELLERERFRKRMRVEDGVLGYSASPQGQDRFGAVPMRISSEDERRLNLIRDHGRAQVNLPFDGEQRPNGVPVDRYPSMDSQSHYAWSGTDRDLYGPRSGLTGNDSAATHVPLFFNPKNPPLREGSYGGYQDPTGATDFLDPGRFVHLESKELERKDWDARNIVRSNASPAGISQEQYGHLDAPSHPSRSYGYGDVVEESLKHYTARHIPDVNSKHKQYLSEEPFSNLQNQVPHSSSYAGSQESREMLVHPQHLRQTCVSEPGYPHTNSYQSPLVSKVGHYGHVDGPVHEYVESKHELHAHRSEGPSSFETEAPLHEDSFSPLGLQNYHMASRSNVQFNQRDHMPMQSGSDMVASVGGQVQGTQTLHPPPPQPLLRPPPEPPLSRFQVPSSLSIGPPPISPVTVGLSVDVSHHVQGFSGIPAALEAYISKELPENTSTGIATERQPLIPQILSNRHVEDGQAFSLKHALTDRKTIIDAANIFFQPHRATRPDHIVVILRGLPGSGKSYLAKVLRDLEIDNGGNAPRIHCMDDYFMTEVEKVEESDGSKSSGSVKGKKQVTRKVMEYCYEPEMEEAYRSSMLKAFKKTVEDGIFTFVIVDDRNLRVADFAQFWAIGKRSGYEVYLLEATYKDPTGCAARNVHGFTLDDIKGMADKWEQAPALYLQLDIQSLFRGDDLNESNIQEVDMDMEDMPCDERVVLEGHDRKSPEGGEEIPTDKTDEGSLIMGGRWVTEGEDLMEARELGKSKWSKDFDEDGDDKSRAPQKSNALSGLIQAYGKGGKSVRWGDRVGKEGFSIGASNNQCISLIIGSGSGYNVKSNPLPEEESSVEPAERSNTNTSRKRSAFLEHIRAERESFRAVFDRRRQRIGGLNDAEDD